MSSDSLKSPCCSGYLHLKKKAANQTKQARAIINADDLGLSVGIDNAIFRLAESGAITSASLMAVGEDFERSALWASRQKNLSIGIHLCLTDGLKPLTSTKGLAGKDGRLPHLRNVAMRAFCHRLPLQAIEDEFLAQIERVLSMGVKPTHLDSHQHVHTLPGVAEAVVRLAGAKGLAVRHTSGPLGFGFRCCWNCGEYWKTLCRPGAWKSIALRKLGASLKRQVESAGIITTDAYVSPSSLCGRMRGGGSEESASMIAELVATVAGVSEWVVHPGDLGQDHRDPEWMMRMRTGETTLLERNAHICSLRAAGVIVKTYADLNCHDWVQGIAGTSQWP